MIYEGQQIAQQRLALTQETQAASDKYNEAMNNTKLQATTPEGGTQQLTYEIITSQDPFSGLCMRIVDVNGNVVVPGKTEFLSVTSKNEEGEDETFSITSPYEFVTKYMTGLDSETISDLSNKSLSYLADYYNKNYSNTGISVQYTQNQYASLKNENERFCYDEYCTDPEYLQQMLTSGEWLLQQVSASEETGWENIVWQGSSAVSEVYDTSDDAAAEAEYEAAMTQIQKQDKLLELRLEQVQTQQESVQTELESIKQVIDKNIEDSFGTFA